MVTSNLFEAKDLDQLRQAAASGQEISLTRTLQGLTMTASTSKAPPVWGCEILFRLEKDNGRVYSSQFFKNTEEMMRYI